MAFRARSALIRFATAAALPMMMLPPSSAQASDGNDLEVYNVWPGAAPGNVAGHPAPAR